MSEHFKKIKKALEELPNYGMLLDFHTCIFYIDGDELYYNTDNNAEDLYNGDGDTYGGWMPEKYAENDKYLIANIDTLTGTWQTEVFLKEKQTTLEELEETYG